MKSVLLFSIAALCMTPLALQAESPSEGKPKRDPSLRQRMEMWEKKHAEMLKSLPKDLRDRFESARKKVLQNPKVKELRKKADDAAKEFRDAMREEMRKVDPELEEKMQDHFQSKRRERLNISEEDQAKLQAAREKAMQDPAVKAAEAKKKAATTPQERRNARQEFQDALHKAMLDVDRSVKPILDKIKKQDRQASSGGMAGAPEL